MDGCCRAASSNSSRSWRSASPTHLDSRSAPLRMKRHTLVDALHRWIHQETRQHDRLLHWGTYQNAVASRGLQLHWQQVSFPVTKLITCSYQRTEAWPSKDDHGGLNSAGPMLPSLLLTWRRVPPMHVPPASCPCQGAHKTRHPWGATSQTCQTALGIQGAGTPSP